MKVPLPPPKKNKKKTGKYLQSQALTNVGDRLGHLETDEMNGTRSGNETEGDWIQSVIFHVGMAEGQAQRTLVTFAQSQTEDGRGDVATVHVFRHHLRRGKGVGSEKAGSSW